MDVIELLIPELRKRGLFWDDYCVPGGTYRENTFEMPGQAEPLPDHPAAAMVWRSPRSSGGQTNGVTSLVNGHSESKVEAEIEVGFDPVLTQFC